MKKGLKFLLALFAILIITGCGNKKEEQLENVNIKLGELTNFELTIGKRNISVNNGNVVVNVTKEKTKDLTNYEEDSDIQVKELNTYSIYLDDNLIFTFDKGTFLDYDYEYNIDPSIYITKIIGDDSKEYLVFAKYEPYDTAGFSMLYYIIGDNKKVLAKFNYGDTLYYFSLKGEGKEKYGDKDIWYNWWDAALYNNKIYYLGSDKDIELSEDGNDSFKLDEYVIKIKDNVVNASKTGNKYTAYDGEGASGGLLTLPWLEIVNVE